MCSRCFVAAALWRPALLPALLVRSSMLFSNNLNFSFSVLSVSFVLTFYANDSEMMIEIDILSYRSR